MLLQLNTDMYKLPEKNNSNEIRMKRNHIENNLKKVNEKISDLKLELKKVNALHTKY